jgi:hypothetical protein
VEGPGALGERARAPQRAVKAGDITPTEITPGGHLRFDLDDLRRQIREPAARRHEDDG